MGAIKEAGKDMFEIHYGGRESPFTGGGIDSSAPPPYIAPNSFTAFQNAFIKDNQIVAGTLSQITPAKYQFSDPAAYSIGLGDLAGVPFEVTFNPNAGSFGTLYVYSYGILNLNNPVLIGTFVLTQSTGEVGLLTFVNVNGICYFSAPGLYNIYTHNNIVASILTDYLGCSYLGELNGRLVALNVIQELFTANALDAFSTISGNSVNTTGTQSTVGTGTITSAVAGFASFAIPTLDYSVQIQLIIDGVVNMSAAGVGQVTTQFQYSIDNGVTWVTFYTGTYTSSQTIPGFFQTVNFGGVANVDTIQIRMVSTLTNFVAGTVTIDIQGSQIQLLGGFTTNPILQAFPFQVAWSAPTGAYSIWQPLDVNALVTGAGFNNLPDVEDIITGFFTTGPTGYILRQQGISEMTPLNSGIQPYDFNHLWASHKGIGALNILNVVQYGSVGYFVSDTDIFTIGYDGINVIAGKAKSTIYSYILNQNLEMAVTIGTIVINNEPFLAYVLAFVDQTLHSITYFIFRADTKEWWQGIVTIPGGQINLNLASVSLQSLDLTITSSVVFDIQAIFNGDTTYSTQLWGFTNLMLIPSTSLTSSSMLLEFNAEEIGFAKYPTIRGVGLYIFSPNTFDLTDYTLNISIGNRTFNLLAIETGTDSPTPTNQIFQGWNYYLCSPDDEPYTGVSPQLTITFIGHIIPVPNDQFVIGKVVLFGGIDSTQMVL